jgi:hypothetical protein
MFTPARLVDQHRHCPCGCRLLDREQIRPGWYAALPAAQRALHDGWTRRELWLWQAAVWAPESGRERAVTLRVVDPGESLMMAVIAAAARWRAAAARVLVLVPGAAGVDLVACLDCAGAPPAGPVSGGRFVIPP